MASLNSVLDIAKTALLTTEKAINVTSHNIANANTPGYTRQEAVLEPQEPVMFGGLMFGTGVKVVDVKRYYQNFQTVQLRDSYSSLSGYQSLEELVKKLEGKFNDFSGSGLSSSLNAFFNSISDISNSPSSYGERSNLLSNASVLAQRFNDIDSSIRLDFSNINNEITSNVYRINNYASQIADLNKQIATVEISGTSANDLRDQRDVLLEGLSKIVNITTVENATGQVDVSIAGGFALVAGYKTFAVETEVNNDNPNVLNIKSSGTVINSRITGGSLKGILDGAGYYQKAHDKLNLLAASLTKEMNVQHAAGYGLDGSTGLNFFSPQSIYSAPSSFNTGGAVISGNSITDFSQLTLDDYDVRFASPAAYTIVNKGTGAVVASGAYTSGSPITVDGISFTISDNSGAPATGDSFTISVTKNAARDLSVAITDPNKIAAASTAAGVPGDNTNALAMVGLKNSPATKGSTFLDYYNGIVSDIGVVANEASSNVQARKSVAEQLQTARDSASGVSMEEEAVNLVRLQRAYQAAAKVVATVDQMFDELLSIR
ncbi:MAG: flagellar hook-associated protein FlgK [Deltaproteobacteria bacterium]|nr:flagellar hook-associated protein FlgK [Deltaproteobacteria bacterium]